jgi:hypothetical protein
MRPEDESLRPRPTSGGQSGDLQGLSDTPGSTSESVAELVEEGQYFEAGILSGIENVPEPDQGEIETEEVPEDDVPIEYLRDEDHPNDEARNPTF